MESRSAGRTQSGWLLALFVVFLVSSTAAHAQRKPKEQKTELGVSVPEEQAIDNAISEMLGAWQVGDVELLHRYYADDVTVVSGAWEPPLVGWTRYLQAYQSQRARMQGASLERRNTYINLRGNFAWAVYQWEFAAVVDGKPSSAGGHTTLILEKRKDRWVLVHNHTSIVPEVKSPEPTPPPGTPKPATPPSAAGRDAGAGGAQAR